MDENDDVRQNNNNDERRILLAEGIRQHPRRLLECLRKQLVMVDPTTEDEEKHTMELILQHRSKFPSKLRGAITEISSRESRPSFFLTEVYAAARAFFFGRQIPVAAGNRTGHHNGNNAAEALGTEPSPPFQWWHGLNCDVDTEQEAEVAIRFFPKILSESREASPLSSLNGCYPIYMLLVCSRALPFVPLFAELGAELGRFKIGERGGLTSFMKNVIFHLSCNNILRDELREESSGKLDEASVKVMMRLKKTSLMTLSDIYEYDLVNALVHRSMRKMSFRTEQRFRFLLDWNPSILEECGRKNNTLLCHYIRDLYNYHLNSPRKAASSDLDRFKVICGLGMTHYPKQLGFVFHHNSTPLRLACEIFGTKKITRLVDYELASTLQRNNNINNNNDNDSSSTNTSNTTSNPTSSINSTLRDFVIAAATNDKISLDGVYILFRRDPIALLPESYTSGS
jgi:hypothetical protein